MKYPLYAYASAIHVTAKSDINENCQDHAFHPSVFAQWNN